MGVGPCTGCKGGADVGWTTLLGAAVKGVGRTMTVLLLGFGPATVVTLMVHNRTRLRGEILIFSGEILILSCGRRCKLEFK